MGGNTANGAVYSHGGGIFAGGTVSIVRTSVSGNTVNGDGSRGGGISAGGAVTLEASMVSGNSVVGTPAGGGGVFSGSLVTMSNSTVAGNHSDGNGGGVATYDAVDIVNSTITDNTAGLSGGGAWIYGGISAVHNSTIGESTIYDNRALANGGSIFVRAGTLYLNETIVSSDVAGLLGSAIIPRFSLIGYNAGSGLAEAPIGSPDANGNLIGGPQHGFVDPKLGPLVFNGGPAFLDGSRLLTLALLPGSPAIDAGDPSPVAGVNGVPANDERGAPFGRVFGGRIDMGAVESQPNPLPGDYNFNGIVDAADYSVWRDTLGSTTDLRADGTASGVVDVKDFFVWKENFGATLGGGASEEAGTVQSLGLPPSASVPRSPEAASVAGAGAEALAESVGRGAEGVVASGMVSPVVRTALSPAVRLALGVPRVVRDDALLIWLADRANVVARPVEGM